MTSSSFILLLLVAVFSVYAYEQPQGTYLGCYMDNAQGYVAGKPARDLPVLVDEGYDNQMIPSKCVAQCASRGYYYAGLQAGRQCFCGNSTFGSYCPTLESRCGTCIANSAFKCGTTNINSVFVALPGGPGFTRSCLCGDSAANAAANCLRPGTYQSAGTYLGCYNDDFFGNSTRTGITNRDLPVKIEPFGYLPSECLAKCTQNNYYYAAIQAGGECWCSNQRYGSFCAADESSCSTPCQKDSSKTCGGGNFNAVYIAKAGGPGQNSTCACGNKGKCINLPPLTLSATMTSYGCATQYNTLSYSISASGGVAPYKYSVDDSTFSANTDFNRIKQGNSTITVVDWNDSNVTTLFFVGPATSVSVSAVPDVSYGFSVSAPGAADGYIILQAKSGLPPYSYALYPKSKDTAFRVSGSASVAATIKNLEAGSYTAYATDANGCQSTAVFISVNTPTLPSPPTSVRVAITNSDPSVSASASWVTPVNTGYAKVLGYSVQWGFYNGTGVQWTDTEMVGANSAVSDVSPLSSTQSTRRYVRVATINSAGTGAYTAAYEFQSLCAAGRYSSSTNCSYCPSGTSTFGSIGRSSCRSCLAGTYSGLGSANCSPCVDNTYSNYGASSCIQCAAGTIAATSYCQPCAPGSYNPSKTSSTCIACPANTYSSRSGSSSCQPCAAGYTSNAGAQYCVDSTGYKK